jgi:hypothetical protein
MHPRAHQRVASQPNELLQAQPEAAFAFSPGCRASAWRIELNHDASAEASAWCAQYTHSPKRSIAPCACATIAIQFLGRGPFLRNMVSLKKAACLTRTQVGCCSQGRACPGAPHLHARCEMPQDTPRVSRTTSGRTSAGTPRRHSINCGSVPLGNSVNTNCY